MHICAERRDSSQGLERTSLVFNFANSKGQTFVTMDHSPLDGATKCKILVVDGTSSSAGEKIFAVRCQVTTKRQSGHTREHNANEMTQTNSVEFVGESSSTEVTHVEAFSGKRLVQSIWAKYDKDQDGQLNPDELQPLFHDFIGHPINKQDALDFLNSIDKDGNAMIDAEELALFIEKGLRMSRTSRSKYASRSAFHKEVIAFFDGVDLEILRQNKALMRNYRNVTINDFVNSVWQKYDADRDGQLNAGEMKVFFSDFIGEEVSHANSLEFLASVDQDGNSMIDKEELVKFIETGTRMSDASRTKYGSRSDFHKKVIQFFYGIEREIFQQTLEAVNSRKSRGYYGFFGAQLGIDLPDLPEDCLLQIDLLREVNGVLNPMSNPLFVPVSTLTPFCQYAISHRFGDQGLEQIKFIFVTEKTLRGPHFDLSVDDVNFHAAEGARNIFMFIHPYGVGPVMPDEKIVVDDIAKFTSVENAASWDKVISTVWKRRGQSFLPGHSYTFSSSDVPSHFEVFFFRLVPFSEPAYLGVSVLAVDSSSIWAGTQTHELPMVKPGEENVLVRCSFTFTLMKFKDTEESQTLMEIDNASAEEEFDKIMNTDRKHFTASPQTSSPVPQEYKRSNTKTSDASHLIEENDRLKIENARLEQECWEANDLAKYHEDLAAALQEKVTGLEDQLIDVNDIIEGKSKVVEKMELLNARLKRKLAKAPTVEDLKKLEMDVVRLQAEVDSGEKHANKMLNRIEAVHKKRFGYIPKNTKASPATFQNKVSPVQQQSSPNIALSQSMPLLEDVAAQASNLQHTGMTMAKVSHSPQYFHTMPYEDHMIYNRQHQDGVLQQQHPQQNFQRQYQQKHPQQLRTNPYVYQHDIPAGESQWGALHDVSFSEVDNNPHSFYNTYRAIPRQ